MSDRPAVSTSRKALAAILTAATLATGGVAFALSDATAAATTTTSTSSTDSGFASTGSTSSSSGSAQTTTSGS
ncbi:MAG TPA: hypothetical protein VGK18_04570 [Propionicimonas sp.]|uniref:hypothetical protein n=1 Tax=Propionicimonas sp. TaxID=1955623 RepID=UPI002F3F7B2D